MKNIAIFIVLFFQLFGNADAQTLFSRIDSIASAHDMMGGTVVVFSEKKILEAYNFGFSDKERGLKVGINTKFRVASISKTVTAIAILQLVERNLLSLNEDISKILGFEIDNPFFPLKKISPLMLLSHTSSLQDGRTYHDFMQFSVHSKTQYSLHQLLTVSGKFYDSSQFHDHLPGSYFVYSNLNFLILGTIVEKISGLAFDEYCKKYIFSPLHIQASFDVNDIPDMDSLAVLYRKESEIWKPQFDDHRGVKPFFASDDSYQPGINASRYAPQGGLKCSANDLVAIFQDIFNPSLSHPRILNKSTVSLLLSESWRYDGTNGDDYDGLFLSWGLGIQRSTSIRGKDKVLAGSKLMLGHCGEAYGLLSDIYFDPVRKLGFVFITNGVGKNTHTNTQSAFFDVEQAVFKAIEEYLSSKEKQIEN